MPCHRFTRPGGGYDMFFNKGPAEDSPIAFRPPFLLKSSTSSKAVFISLQTLRLEKESDTDVSRFDKRGCFFQIPKFGAGTYKSPI